MRNKVTIVLLSLLFTCYTSYGQKKSIYIKAIHKSERVWDDEIKDYKSYYEADIDASISWVGEKVAINEKENKQTYILGTGNTKSTDVADFSIMNCKDINGNNCLFTLVLNKIKELNCVEIIYGHHSDRYYFNYEGMKIKNGKTQKN